MSRSEQPQDASMDEILASIRKIISDDDADAADADMLNAALDDYASAPPRPSESYMGDLTRALIAEPTPQPADDDIFDEATPAPGYARRMSDALAEAIRAPEPAPQPIPAFTPAIVPAYAPETVDDDADLFEAGATPVEEAEPIEALEIAVETVVEDDDDAIAELDDPIALGPEIELVDEIIEASAPEPEAPADTIAAAPVAMAMPVAAPASPLALAPPPPPPPPVIAETRPELPPAEAMVPVEAKTPDEPVPPAEPAEPPVVEASIAAESPALASPEAAAPVAEVATAVGETLPSSTPEIGDAVEAAASSDVPPVIGVPSAEPVASAGASSAPEPEPPTSSAAAPAKAAPPVSEDMMASLLKPMLKEWLDANMPRIVAKAMGEGGKPDAEPPAS